VWNDLNARIPWLQGRFSALLNVSNELKLHRVFFIKGRFIKLEDFCGIQLLIFSFLGKLELNLHVDALPCIVYKLSVG